MISEAKMRNGSANQVPLRGAGNVRFIADEQQQVICLALLRAEWDEKTAAKYGG